MDTLVDTLTAALSSGVNPITAIREAAGYSLEQLAVVSGFAVSDLTALEETASIDAETLSRITSALGLPGGTITG